MKKLISQGCDPNATWNGAASIHHAIEKEELSSKKKGSEVPLFFIEHGADLNQVSSTGNDTPLHLACKMGSDHFAIALARNGAPLNPLDANGNTPLQCQKYLNETTINYLVSEGCSYCPVQEAKVGSKRARSPVVDSNPQATALMAKHPSSALIALWEALMDSTCGVEVCMAIVNHPRCGLEIRSRNYEMKGPKHNDKHFTFSDGATPLLMAANANRADVVVALVEAGADVNSRIAKMFLGSGLTALHLTVFYDAVDAMQALLSAGADVAANFGETGLTPLFFAQSATAVNALAAKGAALSARISGRTPLHETIRKGATDAVSALLALGVNKDIINNKGNTPLHVAVATGNFEIVKLLVNAGADVNVVNGEGWTPLHLGICQEKKNIDQLKAILEVLLQRGALIDAKSDSGFTPLHYAIILNDPAAFELFLSKDANLAAIDYESNTPLHLAAERGYGKFVEKLVAKGANTLILNRSGQTPLQLFMATNHSGLSATNRKKILFALETN